jgi:hypothetical protein
VQLFSPDILAEEPVERRYASLIAGLVVLFTVQACTLLQAQITGGMLNPAMDSPGEPFSYFWRPNDVVGTLYAPVAAEVTPEGYLYTGFGELMFFTGNPLVPVDKRVKTLAAGYLPVVSYEVRREGVLYSFRIFAADLGGSLERLPVNFAIVRLSNISGEPRAAFLSSGWRFSAPVTTMGDLAEYRFRQRFDLIPKELAQGQSSFNPAWKYDLEGDAVVRDGRALYFFPKEPAPFQASMALTDSGLRMVRYFTGEVGGNPEPTHSLNPHTPMGIVSYRVALKPGETRELCFKVPIAPLPSHSPERKSVSDADAHQALDATARFWEGLLANPPLRIPEQKVQEYLLANTVYDLLAIDRVGDDYVPNVNKFQYHQFYGGSDTAHMLVALDYMGLPDIARRGLLYSLAAQRADGAFIIPHETTRYNYWETFGFALWGWGRHYRLTKDENFLRQVYPGVVRAMQWEREMISKDALGLMPASEIPDDAFLKDARSTGQHVWMLIGLRNALQMAEAIGNREDAEAFSAEYKRFRDAFDRALAPQTAKTGGYIPPALERTTGGNDWDNLLMLYPEPLFEPFDPRVTATIRKSRSEYIEGILHYVDPDAIAKDVWPLAPEGIRQEGYTFKTASMIHYWHTPDNAQNALVRGRPADQIDAVRDLYALLLHTTSTHAPQEYGAYGWSTRDHHGNNLLPDGPASGKTIELIRNMLVREYKNELVLFSALSPAWLKPGKSIEIVKQPTEFGPVSVTLKSGDTGLEVAISPEFRKAPDRIVLRIPWFYQVEKIEADGKPARVSDEGLVLRPGTRKISITGKIKPGTAELSYLKTVQDYKIEYKRRYQEFLRTGTIKP